MMAGANKWIQDNMSKLAKCSKTDRGRIGSLQETTSHRLSNPTLLYVIK